jgi:Ca-activated chloride channel homolog
MHSLVRSVLIAAVLLCAMAFATFAQAENGALAIRRADGTQFDVASLETRVDMQIHGLLAEVQVRQRFRNEGEAWQQGQYLLPLPEGAAVYAMTLHVGGRVLAGEIREKEAARSEYAQAVASGRKASLVEAQSANLFRTAIANVAPGESVEVDIRYWQQVEFRDGEFSLTLPLTFTPRYGASPPQPLQEPAATLPAGRAGAPTVVINATLQAGLPLARVESATHTLAVKKQQQDRYQISLADSVVAPDRDFVLRWAPQPSAAPVAALLRENAADAQYALLMLVPPSLPAATLPRELILVIDTSGSMEGQSIIQAREALDQALQRLTPRDRFNVIQFNSVTTPLFPQAVPATPQDVQLAREWVASLRATGGTEMLPALQLALRSAADDGHVRQVVFATDGAVEQAEALYTTIENELGASRLFPIGIGSAPNAHFLQRAAELGRGSAVTIRKLDEVAGELQKLFAKLDRPALRDLRLNLPAAAEVYPQQLPDLYQGEALLLVARLDSGARSGGKAELLGQLAGAPWSQQMAFDLEGDARGLGRLWAQRKIGALEDALRRGGDETVLKPQLLALALQHQLVSRYTSLVAVDKTPQRPADAALQSVEVENALPDGSTGFAQTATPARLWTALGLLCLLLALFTRNPAATCRLRA